MMNASWAIDLSMVWLVFLFLVVNIAIGHY